MSAVMMDAAAAAQKLGVEPWQLNRLLCNQTLQSSQDGFRPEDLARLSDGSDIDGPEMRAGWIDSRAEQFRADKFVSGVKRFMRSRIPDECPKTDQAFRYAGAIHELGTTKPKRRLVGREEMPHRNLAECYAVCELRRHALRTVNRLPLGKVKFGIRSDASGKLGQLFKTADQYRRITDAAWESFQEGSISIQHEFTVQKGLPGRPARTTTRTFHLRHSSITGLDKARLIRLAF